MPTRERILFVAPLTMHHGQGRVSCEAHKVFMDAGARLTTLSYGHGGGGPFRRLAREGRLLLRLLCALTTQNYERVYWTPSRRWASSLKDALILWLCDRFQAQARCYAHLHGSDLKAFLEGSGAYGRWLAKLYERRLDCMILLSPSHGRFALGEHFPHYEVIENFSDLSPSSGSAQRKQLQKDLKAPDRPALRCFHLSNPDSTKGGLAALRFARSLALDSGRPVRLTFIGWTEASFLGLHGQDALGREGDGLELHFLGRLDGTDKIDAMLAGGVCLFFSEYPSEAQPLAVIEALSLGIPVLTHDFKMLKDFSADGAIVRVRGARGHEFEDYQAALRAGAERRLPEEFPYTRERFSQKLLTVVERSRWT